MGRKTTRKTDETAGKIDDDVTRHTGNIWRNLREKESERGREKAAEWERRLTSVNSVRCAERDGSIKRSVACCCTV